jgi:serine/threonine protein kinase
MAASPSVIGRYQVLNQLAQGGMGQLLLARDPVIDRLVAIKLLRDGFDLDRRERFAREARSAGRLRHPNIVTIFDVGEHEGQPFIAMEYIEGETLSAIVRRKAPLTLAAKMRLMDELLSGLQYAHRAGIVHRDIKPGNVMVDADGVLKILDFGIARISGAAVHTQAGMLIGTLNYMAPEQMTGEPDVDGRADLFSAGALFYELLSYQQAFAGGLESGILNKIINVDPEPLTALDPTLDPALAAIVSKCLAKPRDDRYADAAAARRDLAGVRRRIAPDVDEREAVLPVQPAAERIESRRAPSAPDTGMRGAPPAFEGTMIVPAPPRQVPADPAPAPEAADRTVVFLPPPATAASGELPDVQLVVTRSLNPRVVGRTLRLEKPAFSIGRGPECDLNLPDGGWSRMHAEIRYEDDGFVLEDKGSRNGTYLDGRLVRRAPLLFGNVITIGQTDLTFSYGRQTALPDLTGCVVDKRYTLLRLLRESAKGALYAARHEGTQGDVAIKLLSPDLVRYQRYRENFRREAQIAARLRHPNICGVIDSGPATLQPRGGGDPVTTEYVCSELMTGGSLLERIDSGQPVSAADAATWLTAIAGALDHAHRHDVLHGDLKPSAIVFDEDDHPYLTDFAIGQQAMNAEGRPAAGTPAYMAPELWTDGAITPATDQFALAAIFYYVVTGSRPFEGQEHPEVRARNFRRGVIPAHEEAVHNRREGLPRAVSLAFARALAPAPAERFDSATAFVTAFRAALRHIRPAEGPEVFISYQRDVSAPLAMYFADRLKAQGIRAFIDTQGIDRAGRFPPQIERAIEDTDVFICLLAATTLESDYVLDEIRAAHRFEKPMIPVMQESYRFAGSGADQAVAALLGHQGLPVLDRRNLYLDHTADDLVRLVKSAIAQRDRD